MGRRKGDLSGLYNVSNRSGALREFLETSRWGRIGAARAREALVERMQIPTIQLVAARVMELLWRRAILRESERQTRRL